MRLLGLAIEALLAAPALALLGLAFGIGDRFGAPLPVWPGAAAALGAIVANALASSVGIDPWVAAGLAVPMIGAGALGAGLVLTSRAELRADPTRYVAAAALVAVASLSLAVLWRGSGTLAPSVDAGPVFTVLGGPSVSRAGPVTAGVALAAVAGLAAALLWSRLRVRLWALGRSPELLAQTGHDHRQLAAFFGAVGAGAGALAGVLLARHQSLSPLSAVPLTVLGAEVALLGGLGSFGGSLGAATVLSLLQAVGNDLREGWGSLAGHAVVLVVLAVQPARSGALMVPGGGRWTHTTGSTK